MSPSEFQFDGCMFSGGTIPQDTEYMDSIEVYEERQKQVINSVVGCLYCDTSANFYRKVDYDKITGMYVMTCEEIEDANNYENVEDVKCPDLGYLSVKFGYIPEVEKITCDHCSTILPNCEFCSNSGSCDFCSREFLPVTITDANFGINTLCVKQYCGLLGRGDNCDKDIPFQDVSNCLKANVLAQFEGRESCVLCEPGYSFYIYYYS